MVETIVYKNHLNETFDFGKNGVFLNESELHDYSWNVTKKNNMIAAFDYAVSTRKFPVTIICASEAEGIARRNALFEVTEKDVLALEYGRLYIGDYYFKCYVQKSVKKNYLASKRYMTVTLTLATDCPYWVRETSTVFTAGGAADGVDYPHDYAYDFGNDSVAKTIVNGGIVASPFRLAINGPCVNPSVTIGGNVYQVNVTVAAGEYLMIDSSVKTVTLYKSDGTQTNVFNNRNREAYIFEKIPAGENSVAWSGDFSLEITLLEERSEPKWT